MASDIFSPVWMSHAVIAGDTPSPGLFALQGCLQPALLPGVRLCAGSQVMVLNRNSLRSAPAVCEATCIGVTMAEGQCWLLLLGR